MKAIVYEKYGLPDVLQLRDVEKPAPKDHEVLIKVHAASVNSWDWELLTGRPYVFRFWGIFKPKHTILGSDVAGTVEAVGRDVQTFQPGDEVFGDLCNCGWGGFAEYVCAKEEALALKPGSVSFEEAAAFPQAGVMAFQGIQKKRQLRPGDKVLINGGGGGVGTFAIQIAKSIGAEVTAVDSGKKFDLMRSLGADHLVDYMREDFTRSGKQYDLILDVKAHRSMFDYRRALRPGGVYVMIGGTPFRILQVLFLGPWFSKRSDRKTEILMHEPNKYLTRLCELFESGTVRPVIDRCYPLQDTPEALRRLGEGDVMGKVVIIMEDRA